MPIKQDYYALIQEMKSKLPAEIVTLDQIRALPWGGNAAWDVPIIMHLDRVFTTNEKIDRETRKRGYVLAAYLMTGEGSEDDPISDRDFDEALAVAMESQQ